MKTKAFITVAVLSALTLALTGCATGKPRVPQVTIPNGSTPINAPPAPMNDGLRGGSWNHGNGVLWVTLHPEGQLTISDPAEKDSSYDFKGYSRVKFGWWRGVRGKFSIDGRRLDAPAPPLRAKADTSGYGDLGFCPSYMYFPTEGYWEITGHAGDKSLTFVMIGVHLHQKVARPRPVAEIAGGLPARRCLAGRPNPPLV